MSGARLADTARRWTCDCCDPPVLLAMIAEDDVVEIKGRPKQLVRIEGRATIVLTCRRCEKEHTITIDEAKEQAA